MDYNDRLKNMCEKIDGLLSDYDCHPTAAKNVACFFDIDGTLTRKDSLTIFIEEIINRGILQTKTTEDFLKVQKKWKNRECDFNIYLKSVLDFIPEIKTFSKDILLKISQDIIAARKLDFYYSTWLLLIKLKLQGYKLIAVSGCPDFISQEFLNSMGIAPYKIHSLHYYFKRKVFTGKINLDIIKNKADFIKNEYQGKIDFQNSIALGDTFNDHSMLELVGKPIAINPNLELARFANEKNWPILIERKNLLIRLQKDKFYL